MQANIPDIGKERIVIIGGGFAGLEMAKRLAKSDYQIVLLDKNNFHQFQPLFYQVAMAGLEPSSISFPFRKLFQNNPNVAIRITEVEAVEVFDHYIDTSIGEITYDHLVIAIGADTNFFGNEQVARHAIPMKSVSEALYLRNQILTDYEQSLSVEDHEARQSLVDIAIVGGGPTGVEVAGALAEMRKYVVPKEYRELDSKEIDIHLIQGADSLLNGMSKKSGDAALSFLTNLGVKVKLNTFVTGYDGEWVEMNDGTRIRTKKLIWAAGIIGNRLRGLPSDAMTKTNRLKVDRYNQVEGIEDVYAIGDIAYMEEKGFERGHPQVAQVAIQQAKNLAKNFKNISRGKPLSKFSYNDKGSMATIGRNKAVVDLPKNRSFAGSLAWYLWLAVHLFAIIGAKNRIFVFLNWVINYITYDQSLRLIIKPFQRRGEELELQE